MRNVIPAGFLVILILTVPLLGIPLAIAYAVVMHKRGKSTISPKMAREADVWARQPARWTPELDR